MLALFRMILAAGIAKVWLLHDPDAERGGLQAYSAVEFHALSAQKHGICLARPSTLWVKEPTRS